MMLKYKAVWNKKLAVFSATLLSLPIFCQPANSQIPVGLDPLPVSPIPADIDPVPIASPPPMLIVHVDSIGQIYINGQLVASDIPRDSLSIYQLLPRALINFNTYNRCGLVVVTASATTNYALVVDTIDLLRRLGVDRIALGFPLTPEDGVLISLSTIVEINQLSPPTTRSLYPSVFSNCSQQPFEIPEASSIPPLDIPEIFSTPLFPPLVPPMPTIIPRR